MNKVIISGILTKDVDIRYLDGINAVGNLSLSTIRKFKNSSGENIEEVLLVDVIAFGRLAEIANQYLSKGSKVFIEGRIKLSQYILNDGEKAFENVVIIENLQFF